MFIGRGKLSQSSDIAELIFASEPTLLSFLFGGELACLSYLKRACGRPYGQFSANYQYVLGLGDNSSAGVCATWHANMALEFQQGTLSSLKDFLSTETIIHLLAYNDTLDQCFSPPKEHQLCLGHISVAANYRRLGIATALIEHAKIEAAKVCKTELILDAETSNHYAVDCYLKAGFTVTKQSVFEATQQTFSRMTLLC